MISRTTHDDGIHDSIPIEVYHSIDACSSSRLRDMSRSPAYCRYRMTTPQPDTVAMAVGALVDALLLDPGQAERFAPKDFDARTKDGKARRDELEAAGVRVLSQDDYDRANAIFGSIQASPWWSGLEDVWSQTTVLWTDLATGVKCRARPDILADKGRILCDLKVCLQATENVYLRKCVELWHPQQLAWYARGLEECGQPVAERWILAAHPDAPHEVTAYRMTPDLNAWADRAVASRFEHYAECVTSGVWADGNQVVDVPLPEWARAQGMTDVDFSGLDVEDEEQTDGR